MKKLILFCLALCATSAYAQPILQEASAAQATAGTAGAGYYISPRRMTSASHSVPAGGGTGTVLKKASAADFDTVWGSVSGTGTVTTFTAGTLSPLFTTSVATATSTPALTFTLSNASANLVFAGPTTGAVPPSPSPHSCS